MNDDTIIHFNSNCNELKSPVFVPQHMINIMINDENKKNTCPGYFTRNSIGRTLVDIFETVQKLEHSSRNHLHFIGYLPTIREHDLENLLPDEDPTIFNQFAIKIHKGVNTLC